MLKLCIFCDELFFSRHPANSPLEFSTVKTECAHDSLSPLCTWIWEDYTNAFFSKLHQVGL